MAWMLLVGILMLASGPAQTVWAANEPKTPDNASDHQLAAMADNTTLTLTQGVLRALEKVSGKAVQVELHKQDDKLAWKVTIVTSDGKVDRVYVDGRDGSYLLPVFPAHGKSTPSQ